MLAGGWAKKHIVEPKLKTIPIKHGKEKASATTH
jgi:hypothetical protein